VIAHTEIQERFRRIESIVLEKLKLFETFDIHATWATVGLLAFPDRESLYGSQGKMTLSYTNRNYIPYPLNDEKYGKVPFEILTGLKEIEAIKTTKHQELASHTFAHYYTKEDGQLLDEFRCDIQAMTEIGKRLHHQFRSIVFPRNQVVLPYLNALATEGYLAFRGNQQNRYWKNATFGEESRFKRGMRYLDAYFNISATENVQIGELETIEGLVNIPASRFLRAYSGKRLLERRKLNRIKNEMTAAAKAGTVYHLWWHPHNFSEFPKESFEQLEEVLLHFKKLEKEFDFSSLNMSEIARHAQG
jgi:hypothetical protein